MDLYPYVYSEVMGLFFIQQNEKLSLKRVKFKDKDILKSLNKGTIELKFYIDNKGGILV